MNVLTTAARYSLQAAILATVAACTTAPQSGDEELTQVQVAEAALASPARESADQVQEIFYSVPSPMEMATLLKKAGAHYDMSLLHDVKRVNDYTTSRSRALNLGVYGADLSYASIFNQNQESIIFLSCSKKLADNIGVTKAFDESTIERMEANVENRDSLLNIVSETYYVLDAYLKENDRDYLSAMVITAGWVEGLYLATSIAQRSASADPELLQRIAEQKLSLQNLTDLVQAYNSEKQLDDIAQDLARINEAFAQVHIETQESTVSTDSDGLTAIGGKTVTHMDAETLQRISSVVHEIRNRYIS